MAFNETDHGLRAIRLIETMAQHVCESYALPRTKENRLHTIPTRATDDFVPYCKGGVTVNVDIPLATFMGDYVLKDAAKDLPESVRSALQAHMDATYRHCLEVACQEDPKANAIVDAWDWSKSPPLDALDEAGFGEIVSEAGSEAELHFDVETLRVTAHAFDRHMLREAPFAVVVTVNTEFEHHATESELRRQGGPRDGIPSVDHGILDIDFKKAADFDPEAAAGMLKVFKLALPEPEAPSYGLTR